MNKFSDFEIKPLERKAMQGDQIKVERILNREIVIHSYDIRDSKYKDKGNGKCLYMQIELDNIKRLVWTGSVFLQHYIQQIAENKFPFQAKIIKENDSLKFV